MLADFTTFVVMKKLLSIGRAAKALGVTTTTMRNWDKNGMLHPDERTRGGDRRYSLDTLRNFDKNATIHVDELKTIAYARVSSHDQKKIWYARLRYWRLTAQVKDTLTKSYKTLVVV